MIVQSRRKPRRQERPHDDGIDRRSLLTGVTTFLPADARAVLHEEGVAAGNRRSGARFVLPTPNGTYNAQGDARSAPGGNRDGPDIGFELLGALEVRAVHGEVGNFSNPRTLAARATRRASERWRRPRRRPRRFRRRSTTDVNSSQAVPGSSFDDGGRRSRLPPGAERRPQRLRTRPGHVQLRRTTSLPNGQPTEPGQEPLSFHGLMFANLGSDADYTVLAAAATSIRTVTVRHQRPAVEAEDRQPEVDEIKSIRDLDADLHPAFGCKARARPGRCPARRSFHRRSRRSLR